MTVQKEPDQSKTTNRTETTARPAVIPAGLQHLVAQAVAEVGGAKCSDLNGRRVILALRERGIEVVYSAQVQQWGEMGNVCVYHETGAVCSFCRCDRRS